jgi:Cu(I)/Ag(I) efflux system membrane fusion protein
MKKRYIVLIVILIAVGSFLAGSWVTYQGGRSKATTERKILHYVDPMNPAFKSDKPGIAPCGMPLEPVYTDQGDAGGADLRASLPPGTIRISPEKQQLIGVKTATVEKVSWSHTLRVLGRVTPDETRVYRIKAAVSGWIQEVPPVTTGSLVKGNELLATFSFYSAEFRTALLAYLNAVRSGNISKLGSKAEEQPAQKNVSKTKESRAKEFENIRLTGRGDPSSQVDYYRQILVSYGVSDVQLREMERSRDLISDIEILAPASGFILFRNVSPGQRFDKGEELFRIADLSQVWILGDIFETEASYFKPGMRVKMELPYQKKILYAKVSPVLPQFDPATRTLKIRLVADNPGYVMRPDMLVNVELPVNGLPAIIVPLDAVLDSGLKKTVFVDKGNGFFEPRQVEIGRTLGERVEIAGGLMPGEKIVVSGNFLIDSEARMQQAASGITGKIGRDPVCRMNIDEDRAKTEGNTRDYKGKSYFFCSPECLAEFDKDPERYLKSEPVQAKMQIPIAGSQGVAAGHPTHEMAPKPPGIKKAPTAHDGMAMPGGETGAMPGMPAPDPKAKPKAGRAAPGSDTSGSGSMSVPMPMPMPQSVMPGMIQQPTLPGPGQGGMPMPQGAAPMLGPPGAAPMPGGKAGEMFPPGTGAPGMNQGPSDFPAQGITPGTMPQEAAPMSGAQTGEITPPAREGDTRTRTPSRPPRINPRLQYRMPGTAPQAGPPGAMPMPGGKAGEMPQPVTDHPDVKP